MEIGKIPNSLLEKLVISKFKHTRSDVIIRPGVGIDCAAVDFGERACVLSSDPITGTAKEIGRLAVHVSCNDIASFGVEPVGIMATVLCPAGTTEDEIDHIMSQLADAAASINVDILGGHTEITSVVNRFVISCTAIGKCLKNELITTSGAKYGDFLVITKHVGLEGASVIAHEKEDELTAALGAEVVNEAKSFINDISVVKDGILAARYGANAMHDVTEGGIFGAVWEMCKASGTGAEIYLDRLPVKLATRMICEYYGINPYKLISSGCMLIATPDGDGLVNHLVKNGIEAEVVGRVCGTQPRVLLLSGEEEPISPPESDELYKIV